MLGRRRSERERQRFPMFFLRRLLKRFFVSVGLPVMRNGEVAYYLAVGISVDTFADALKNAALPDQWTVTLIDRDNTIVARSEKHSEVAGTKLRVDLAARESGLEGATYGQRSLWHRLSLDVASIGIERLVCCHRRAFERTRGSCEKCSHKFRDSGRRSVRNRDGPVVLSRRTAFAVDWRNGN